MANIIFHDISYAQGLYNMDADPSSVIFMKMSGFYYGSKVGYYDTQAARNYNNAIRLGKVPGLYHYAGGHPDANVEADHFVGACSPLAKGDILILDYELTGAMNPPADPVAWCLKFMERVHAKTGIWPIFYTYSSMLAEHDFSPVLKNCALWVANYAVKPEGTVPTGGHPYIIHQYQGSPLDTNACFISLDALKQYGYHSATPPPEPVPPATTTTTTTTTTTLPPTASTTSTTTTLPPVPTPPTDWKKLVGTIVAAVVAAIAAIAYWIKH